MVVSRSREEEAYCKGDDSGPRDVPSSQDLKGEAEEVGVRMLGLEPWVLKTG